MLSVVALSNVPLSAADADVRRELSSRFGAIKTLWKDRKRGDQWNAEFSSLLDAMALLRSAKAQGGTVALDFGSDGVITNCGVMLIPRVEAPAAQGEEKGDADSKRSASVDHSGDEDDDTSSSSSSSASGANEKDLYESEGECEWLEKKRMRPDDHGTRKDDEGVRTSSSAREASAAPQSFQPKTIFIVMVPHNQAAIEAGYDGVTPFMVYQVLRGNWFPKRIVVCKPHTFAAAAAASASGSDVRTGDSGHGAGLTQFQQRRGGGGGSGGHHSTSIRVLVEFDTVEAKADAMQKLGGALIRLMRPSRPKSAPQQQYEHQSGDDDCELAYIVHAREASSVDRVHVLTNTDKAFGVTAECVHLLGPIFARKWKIGIGRGDPTRGSYGGMSSAPRLSTAADLAPAPQIQVRVGYFAQTPSSAPADEQPIKAATAAPLGALRKESSLPLQTTTSRPAPPLLPPGWEAFFDDRYKTYYYAYTDPKTGEEKVTWTLPTN